MIKVLTILSGLDGGGVENILLNYLKEIDKKKIQMDIIVHSVKKGVLEEKFESLGCKIYRVTPKKNSILKNFNEISRIIKIGKYDIVHSRMNYKGVTHMLSSFLLGIKIRIVHNHQANMEKDYGIFVSLIIKVLKKITILLATDYMACSKLAAIEMFGEKRVINNKVVILKNAIDLEKYRLSEKIRKKYRNKFLIKEENSVIGVVGRFHNQKNHKFILEIFEKIVTLNDKYLLMLVGGGEEFDKYKKIVKSNNKLRDKVIFTGIRKDVPNLLQAMDIFLLPSKYEGFGNVFIESQISGLPTIASTMVPKETKISNLISYLSLDESSDYWAKFILDIKFNKNIRKNKINEAKEFGFDIKDQASYLQNLYLKSIERNKN